MEDAFYESLNTVALANTTTQLRHRLQLDENYLRLLTLGEQASLALDHTSLQDTLVKGLPNAGVRTACLSCVSEEDASKLVPSMCLLDGERLELDGGAPPGSLVPPQVFELDRRFTFLVFPLAFDSQLLGVIAFSYSDGPNAYLAFRNEIAAALKSIRLRQELVRETRLRERSVQERLATTKRMEALSVLAGGVAHDLNNTLGPLVVLPDVILDELDKLPVEEGAVRELRADVQSIKAASLRATQTIKDLLTLGRQGRMLKEALDLNRLVHSCLADGSVRSALEGASRVQLNVEVTPLPLIIRGSESQMARAIGNLVRNAVEAVAADGKVVVKTSQVQVTTPTPGYENIPPGAYAIVTVSDDGCGIAPHDLSRVFEPFFTSKRTGENSGSGLGLAIVHGVVKEHEGFIDVQSTLERGTTIALYLPALVEHAKQPEQARSAPRGSARILMVDDEPIQLQTLRRVLVHLGYQVDILESGARAFEVFNAAAASRQSPYDLIIMDMMLGEELDGLQILEKIQHLFPTQRAIMTSGYAPSERAQLAANKVLPWLAKPYTIEELGQAVQQALRTEPGGT
jgi:signal transduction histidine kinase/ActR/RegA family two-component response regulator